MAQPESVDNGNFVNKFYNRTKRSFRTWSFGENEAEQLKSQVKDKFQTLISRLNNKLVKPSSIQRQIIDNNIYIEKEEIKSIH